MVQVGQDSISSDVYSANQKETLDAQRMRRYRISSIGLQHCSAESSLHRDAKSVSHAGTFPKIQRQNNFVWCL